MALSKGSKIDNADIVFQSITEGSKLTANQLSSNYYSVTQTSGSKLVAPTLKSYNITVSAGTGGTVSGGGSYTVSTVAQSKSISATPNNGYKFNGWSISGGSGISVASSSSTSTTANIAAKGYGNATATASFAVAAPSYYGTATSFVLGRSGLAATTVGNYALFGGGSTQSATLGSHEEYAVITVEPYNNSLTKGTAPGLRVKTTDLAATKVGNYALFTHGWNADDEEENYLTNTTAYDTSLTRSYPAMSKGGSQFSSGANIGSYALFAGGYSQSITGTKLRRKYSTIVNVYSTSLTLSTGTNLSQGRFSLAGANNGSYVLFAGGLYDGGSTLFREDLPSSTVDAYNTSLTKSTATSLSVARSKLPAAAAGEYVLFAGGLTSSGNSSTVDAYNTSLTRTSVTGISTLKEALSGTSLDNYAIFAGGYPTDVSVDMYDSSLTKTTSTGLSIGRGYLAAATVGNYALFGGGCTSNGFNKTVSTVDVYKK